MKAQLLLLIIIVSLVTAACGTIYRPVNRDDDDRVGYMDSTLPSGERVADFYGTKNTSLDQAVDFSNLRAIENCRNEGKKFAYFHSVENAAPLTVTSMTYGGGYGKSWSGQQRFPIYHTYYSCEDQVFSLGLSLRSISAEDMKGLVKDLSGAVKVQAVPDGSPNVGILQPGDIILRVNGVRVENEHGIVLAIMQKRDQKNVEIQLIRDENRATVKAKMGDISASVDQEQKALYRRVCSSIRLSGKPVCLANPNFK